jgi:uncharacterized protein
MRFHAFASRMTLWRDVHTARRDNPPMHPPSHRRPPARTHAPAPPLSESEIDELQARLDAVPAPLDPLDASMVDGFLCGVLVQPVRVPAQRWLPLLSDVDGRPLPANFDARRLHELAQRRHAELNDAITRRQWFDPWVFELDDGSDEDDASIEAVLPWVAGFATAMEAFPELMNGDAQALTEPLALLYRHLDPEDLEDADDLLEEIESLEPPADLSEAVEGLVRATLLLADVGRPLQAQPAAPRPQQRPPHRPRR